MPNIADDSWPEFEMPEGVGGHDTPADPPQPAPSAQPAQPAAAAAQPAAPAANAGTPAAAAQPGQPGAQPAGAPATGQPGQLPDYRVEQIRHRNEMAAVKAENDRFRNVILGALGVNPQTGQPAVVEDPKTLQLRDTIFSIIPGLKELLAESKGILKVAKSAPAWEEQNNSYWQGVATRTMSSVYDGVANLMLGAGKTGKDLDPEMTADLQESFLKWCERDKTGQRIARYEGQDAGLVPEFLKAFSARYVDPVRRAASVTVQQRGQATQGLPVSGPAGLPAASVPPQTDNSDEDAVHGKAWAVAQQMRTGQ